MLAGVSVGGARVGEWQPLPGLSVFPLLLSSQPAASGFSTTMGEALGSTLHSRAHLAELAPPSGLPLPHLTFSSPPLEPVTALKLDPQL